MKKALKRLRSSQPFNYVATTSVRAVLNATGLRSEQVIKHLHRIGEVESRLPNGSVLRLRSQADDWVSNQVYWRGWKGYEPETVPLFFRLAAAAPVTIDIGAYVGTFTLLAGHANPRGRVLACEPHPAIFSRLNANVELNGLQNVECIRSAIGDRDGVAQFFHIEEGLPTSSSISYEFMAGAERLTSTDVPLIRVDSIVRDRALSKVGLIKIDTESTEVEVVRGALNTLSRDHPPMICEVLSGRANERELESLLSELGYRFYLLTPEGPRHSDRIEGHPEWLNYLFSTEAPQKVALL